MKANTERNQRIGKLLDTKRFSYAVIGQMIGVTRKVVSGVAFRRKHKGKVRGISANGAGYNKTGTGWRPATYQPKKTALDLT